MELGLRALWGDAPRASRVPKGTAALAIPVFWLAGVFGVVLALVVLRVLRVIGVFIVAWLLYSLIYMGAPRDQVVNKVNE